MSGADGTATLLTAACAVITLAICEDDAAGASFVTVEKSLLCTLSMLSPTGAEMINSGSLGSGPARYQMASPATMIACRIPATSKAEKVEVLFCACCCVRASTVVNVCMK